MTLEVQQEYGRLYGGDGDQSPIDPREFVPPRGHFVVAEVGGEAVAMGGWRRGGPVGPDEAEIKRMYVRPAHRRRGLSRVVLSELERSARDSGITRLVLETGQAQPEAIALYRSTGYVDVPPTFGHYVSSPLSVHLGKRLRP